MNKRTKKQNCRSRSVFTINGILVILLLLSAGCGQRPGDASVAVTAVDSLKILQDLEAREDSLEMVLSLKAQAAFNHRLQAAVETEPVQSGTGEDAADDPAIWVNEQAPGKSLVLGTNKTGGIYVYDLSGKELQYKNIGRVNNIDLRNGFILNGREVTLVAASNRSNNAVTLLSLDPATGFLSDSLLNIPSMVDEVYGLCMFRDPQTNEFHVFVNGKDGKIEQWLIRDQGGLKGELLRDFSVNSQPEGMVADELSGRLYIGVEEEGIYVTGARPSDPAGMALIPGSNVLNDAISFDIEGLAVFSHNGAQYLLASSQGNFSYALFSVGKVSAYLTSFIITEGSIDGVEETDGLDITLAALPEPFSDGLLVVQDGFNMDGEEAKNQNFKLVPVTGILDLLPKGR